MSTSLKSSPSDSVLPHPATPPPPYKNATSPRTGFLSMDSLKNKLGLNSESPNADRSRSRGRLDDLASTGRGGAGNFVRSDSATRGSRDDEGRERGREIYPRGDEVSHAGRGGQGNIRSPSRDPKKELAAQLHEEEVRRQRENPTIVSTGRGGVGNVRDTSKSRSRSREPGFSSGRGGAGNIVYDNDAQLGRLEEEDRKEHKHHHPFHSHGRGGQGNIDTVEAHESHPTQVANHHNNEYVYFTLGSNIS
ncbi:hypothetical protein FRC03_010865 [Tulasnella sp. 419]|nr:hypothetical protein FRC02_010428 [Tulasnella sp. 418]KAG8967018.1 hypothetical protein FRC03_010865 [Tulasnella sp. 419]